MSNRNWRVVCRGSTCGAEIAFLRNPKTEKMLPVNVESLSEDNLADLDNGFEVDYDNVGHVRHHTTCPDVKQFSQRNAR